MTAGAYAKDTEVPAEKSRAEIERTLGRYGADHFAYMVAPERASVAFRAGPNTVRLVVPLPEPSRVDGRNHVRSAKELAAAREAEARRRWRALALVVKAKLEAVESGLVTFEEEWFAYLVLPNGSTVFEQAAPLYRQALETGQVVPMLEQGRL
jgi:hypothetical protein